MIIISTRILTKSGVSNLSNHLLNKPHENENIQLMEGFESDFEAFHKEAMLDGSKFAFRHFSINPGTNWTYEQQLATIDKIKSEYGAEDRPHLLVNHSKRLSDGTQNKHLHLVLPERFNGKTLSSSWNYARNEKICRECEFEFGHAVVVGKHNKSASYFVSDEKLKNILLENSEKAMPKASFSAVQHQRSKREGFDLPKAKKLIKQLHEQSDGFKAFNAALSENGFIVKKGRKTAIVETEQGQFVGSLNRLVGMSKKDFLYKYKGEKIEKGISEKDSRTAKEKSVRSVVSIGEKNQQKHGRNSPTSESGRGIQDRPSDRNSGGNRSEPEETRGNFVENFKLEAGLKSPDRSAKLDNILNDIKNLNNQHSKNVEPNSNQIEPSFKISSKTRRSLVKGARNARNFASVVASGSSGDIGTPITAEDNLRQIRAAPKPF
ncbi:relaxase/mobilization nuclease domain-containing protein [Thalassospira lucentensis]|uniref:relaxase/mobilization nuclease domain-containing protein n=1 Tax=Thalassospira lucentensis TaxID=168935 RepID=UPI003D289470